LYGNQKRIDKNKNGRIDREDFKMLRKWNYWNNWKCYFRGKEKV
jgi:hypothetical protein